MVVENWAWYLLIGMNACLLLCMIVLFCCLVRALRLKRLEDDLSEKMRKIPFSIRSSADGLGSANKSMLFTNYVLLKLDGPRLTALQVDNLTEEELAVILKQRRHPTIEDFEEKYGKKVLTEEAKLSPLEHAFRSGEEGIEKENIDADT